MSVLADLYCSPAYDRQAPKRAAWVLTPAWYWYWLGRAKATSLDADLALFLCADPYLLASRQERVHAAYAAEGKALGDLWRCLLGDRA